MVEVTRLSAHPNRRVQIKRQLLLFLRVIFISSSSSKVGTFGFGFDEAVQTGDILEFGVGVQEEGRVV